MIKKLAVLSLVGMTAILAGCGAKTISDEEAKKFVADNYPAATALASGKETIKVEKCEGIFELIFGEPGEISEEVKDEMVWSIDAEYIDEMAKTPGNHSYSLDGKKLCYSVSLTAEDLVKELMGQIPEGAHISGSGTGSWKTTDEGFVAHQESFMDITMTFDGMAEMNSSVKVTTILDYTEFKPAN